MKRKRERQNGAPTRMERFSEKLFAEGVHISWKIFFALLIFTILILMIVWIFQIHMLNPIYERVKNEELTTGADVIQQYLGQEALEDVAYDYAVNNSVCIRVFSIEDTAAHEVASVDVFGDCLIHHLTNASLSRLYAAALENGGTYQDEHEVDLPLAFRNDENVATPKERTITRTYVRIYDHPDSGIQYVIMLNSKMTPMRTVTRTLGMQFSWIVYLVLIAAMLAAYLISRFVARPITRINESAKRLAAGDYQVNFYGHGYRETRELAQTLNYAAGELSKADGLQKELIANISHDLRSPLTMIKGYSEMMRDIPGENTPENMQVIIDEATRLSELVSDLLDISKLQAGTRPLASERFDLTQTVLETMDRYEKLTARDGYCIRFYSDCHVDVIADQSMILQVIYNIINNAINHSGQDKLILVRQTVEGDKVRISVEDHGEGIEPDQLPYIWDRYYKVDRVHRIATVGTGIGLSIVKNILEMHQAEYGVHSVVDQGSIFWFSLPIAGNGESEERA
ncbi:MAG: HAMP domain-containing histidine kinase [Clostridia bacterium]|nr:HAMP domain-containing histidine kinase [Clostridia bacterium]